MRIAGFRTESVRGVPDLAVELREANASRLVVITGPAGSGKTRMLEALIAAKELIAPYAIPETGRPWVRPGFASAKVTIQWELTDDERTWSGLDAGRATTESIFRYAGAPSPESPEMVALLRRYEHDAVTGKVEYFPVDRCVVEHGPPDGTSPMEQRMVRLTRDPRKYSFLPNALAAIAADGEKRQRFAKVLAGLSPSTRYDGTRGAGAQGGWFADDEGHARTIYELSASERDAVILAATATTIDLSNSVVFIDRPELHLGRTYLASYFQALLDLAPGVQLIVASCVPEVAKELGGVVIDLGQARPKRSTED